jgi:protoporphyrinogen oxidase
VKLGRLQIFNNWSPYLVKDKDTVWIGLEYFCNQGDDFWQKSDEEIFHFAVEELAKLDFIDRNDLLDGLIIRTPKAYPVYCGGYENFESIRNFTDKFENLFLIGRNGMHRYNNMDHSMLTAITGVENIIKGIKSKDNIWNINTDKEYYEEDN